MSTGLDIDGRLFVPDSELTWKFARAGGPGGQNVNKVASKAILFWQMAQSTQLPDDVKERLRRLFPRHVTAEGVVVISSQKHRDQERNRQDCLDKLRSLVVQALHVAKPRRPTKPTRGSRRVRLQAKKHRGRVKESRRAPRHDE